jgi:hypothetical protein
METSTKQGKDLRSRLWRFGKMAVAGLFAALICSFTVGAAWADHHDHDWHGHWEHHWHHGWHEGPAIVFGDPDDYYYTPPPDYYVEPEPYGYYGPPAYGPEYYPPRSEGLNLFFHFR